MAFWLLVLEGITMSVLILILQLSALIFQDQEWLEVISIIENVNTLLKIDCVRFENTKISSALYKNILKEKNYICQK
ncbi:hypothetical protein [Rickettsia honei]|uniref:hypothetical protein n=1 Tax=Rickettsia honei TaxID=37816 RepID=UPI001EE65A21|nr:hypothetical protein [Rickettsia honei]